MSKTTSEYICHICGDKAPGRNFGVMSCQSCKAFFRRMVTFNKNMKCKSGHDNCIINKNNRKCCQKCRFKKCITSGMKKELVNKLSFQDTVDNDNDGESDLGFSESSIGNTCVDSDYCSTSDSTEDTIDLLPNFHSIDTEIDSVLEGYCLTDEEMSEGIRRIEDLLTTDWQNSDTEVTPKMNTSSVMAIVRPIATFDKPLNDMELSRLRELIEASNQFQCTTNCAHMQYRLEFKELQEMYETIGSLRIFDKLITECSSFCKNITLFKDICEQDKLSLFKFTFWKLIALKYIFANSPDKTITLAPNNDFYIKGDLTVFKASHQSFYVLTTQFCEGLSPEWIRNPILINLMMVLSLFNDDAPNLTHRHQIRFNQQMYLYLLQRYLLREFRSEGKTSDHLSHLMALHSQLHQLFLNAVKIAKNYFQFLSPLTKELIDS